MDLRETTYWINDLIPGSLEVKRIGDFHVGAGLLDSGERLATTLDFGRVDTGLITDTNSVTESADEVPTEPADLDARPVDVRSEVFAVAAGTHDCLDRVVAATAAFLRDSAGRVPASPGQLLPGVGVLGGLVAEPDVTVRHGLLVVPYVWAKGVPRMMEEAGEVGTDDVSSAQPANARLTVLLQLVLLTDDEFSYARTYGVPALQQAMVEQNVDLLDLGR
ncbi:suppressor of fused domain protein [Corynebacterium pygosceleis]|uniref:Suppressor of fused domain protein n=1 Tax=Corynebacterium pygosceleis TaxID=2800406 RepID=A0A9Q4C9Y8_9CORY|nr:suppressor of fused domain protein [Corynebacterium pygosceleis]MCK7637334.1 suppressor of fused domain protein [Corynebacterium pygosceleis]MCK7675984.1 suppressor of fused domain protein [Corynebacterium pygosceleis]MCL0119890.1 suppressor of fused domain protein [Corynebacterium pygosceleis]MCX7445237.1 suppressor of fused domain protein [Corynebacterium pygosceleis]MCX7468338.1 suppressor of fused domain protein [Corynebacterium pygosceleis]